MAKNRKDKPTVDVVIAALERLTAYYTSSNTELTYDGPFQLLTAVILSAQCTDLQVNRTTPALFSAYPTPQKMAAAPIEDLERLVKSCGFYRMKAKAIKKTAQDLVANFSGHVPKTIDELITLAGVGRKTASVVLSQAFGIPAIAVDTHVKRVAHRLGWTQNTDPEKIESDLRDLVPMPLWSGINGFLILHGRRICGARKPRCAECMLRSLCPFEPLESKPSAKVNRVLRR